MHYQKFTVALAMILMVTVVSHGQDGACITCGGGFCCSFATTTLSEDMIAADAVAIAILEIRSSTTKGKDGEDEISKAKFKVVEVLKSNTPLAPHSLLETAYNVDAAKGQLFLMTGYSQGKLQWVPSAWISERSIKYLKELPAAPKEGANRLTYFHNYLEDSEELLARDAYHEFDKVPYAELQVFKPHMKRDQLVSWIKNTETPIGRRRLYFKMLSVCGNANDVPMLDEMLKSKDETQRRALTELIACYLALRGAEGVPVIEDLFLKNLQSEYRNTYAAILGIHFHLQTTDVIPKERLLKAMRYILERPQMADLVISYLADAKDWSCVEQLVGLFKSADENSNWVKVPVINYLRACPLPTAKEYLQELKKIDPESVKRSYLVFPAPIGDV